MRPAGEGAMTSRPLARHREANADHSALTREFQMDAEATP